MKIVRKPNQKILNILGTSLPETGTELCLSQYSVPVETEKGSFLFNTFTNECIKLNGETIPSELTVSEGNIADPFISHLISNQYYVRKGTDECDRYCKTISILRLLGTSGRISSYTILPTTNCNARCFYCFELGFRLFDMSEETLNETIRFIKETHSDETISITWFGGEPLMGLRQIRAICDSLNSDRIPFRSKIVTNASLFTKGLIEEAKERWHLTSAQITLDGRKETYCARKNYIDLDERVYDTVINNINLLTENGIKVAVRLNIDLNNFEEMQLLVNELNQKLIKRDGLGIYTHPIYTDETVPQITDIWKACLTIEDQIKNFGFITSGNLPKTKAYYCMSANPGSVAIGADGTVFRCEYCNQKYQIGNIRTEIQERKKTAELSDVEEMCRTCPYLPDCTEFTGCPERITPQCREIHDLRLKHALSGSGRK